ncbi:hypothetical protein B0T26DRAFT_868246 [Lasiosphaeria miniovina]|uniref:cellulase n=1 Tax=Lasiosphaeria miniovina TaxID=1954250 RepID=A0AA40B3C6_9PEZI|nr:uncharacterized protein B0T26DRAFT_868246 [Lasiosphaeria miniovina]KAK0726825.1 hypothetical protein B0T26DRAFT_868246 [Lasiosphaeria miniovina]
MRPNTSNQTAESRSSHNLHEVKTAADNTTTSELAEIWRFYVQDGAVIPNSVTTANAAVAALTGGYRGAVKQDFCEARNNASNSVRRGGLPAMGQAPARGMVLVLSLWNSLGTIVV